MTTEIANSQTTDEAQIRALIDDRAKAVRDKNVNEASLNRTLPKAFRQTQIGNKHDVDDTRLENQRVAMEDVR